MRNFILLTITSITLLGCLKKDMLDKDLDNSNFKESNFYTSDDFDNQLGFVVDNTTLRIITSPLGDTLCSPTYTLRLNENFVANLNKEWSDKVILKLYQDKSTQEVDSVTYVFPSNYGQTFLFTGKGIECNATTSNLDARLILEAPKGRATASVGRKTININFTP